MMNTVNRTILIVRPENRAAADVAVCTEYGWQGVPFSPLAIEPLPFSGSLKTQFAAADAVFWVSPTAVETAVAADVLSDCPSHCVHAAVGGATAKALQQAGVERIAVNLAGNDSEAAFALPLWRQLPAGARVLIAGGEGGRNWLAVHLRGLGLRVDVADLYRRVPKSLDWQIFQAANPAAAWVTSVQMAQALFAQVPANMAQPLQSLLYFAHHARIRAALSEAGADYVAEANNIQAALIQLNQIINR